MTGLTQRKLTEVVRVRLRWCAERLTCAASEGLRTFWNLTAQHLQYSMGGHRANKSTCTLPPKTSARFMYKYGCTERLDWLETIILRHQIYFPTPTELNDPLEARPQIAKGTMEASVRTLYDLFVKAKPDATPYERAKAKAQIEYNLPRFGIEWFVRMMEKGLHAELSTQRIYSLAKRPNNLHLWKQYAENHTGYCLEFRNAGPFSAARAVRYRSVVQIDVTDPTQINPSFYFYKNPRWRNEEELRIVTHRSANPVCIPFDPSLLTRIILGRDIASRDEAIIRAWARQRRPELAVASAKDMALR